jgi:hypothetical protein
LRTPISRVRSATATSMMFMMTIAPTTRPMAGSTMPGDHEVLLDRQPLRQRGLRALEREVVLLAGPQLVPAPHHLAHDLLQLALGAGWAP